MYDKELLQIVFACTLLFGVFASFLVLFVIWHKNQKQQHELEKQRLLFELERKELNMGFKERELVLDEVSQEIHDNVGQIAHLIGMNLYSIEQLSTNQEQRELIKYIIDLNNRIINDTRYIAHSLNCDFIKGQGLYRMLEFDTDRINAARQLKCYIEVTGSDKSITDETQLLVYRIAQEAIHNTLQHAKAQNLKIQLIYSKDAFKMVIRDDGMGFDVSIADDNALMGITNMRKRAKLLSGSLDIHSDYGKGCAVVLSVTHQNAA